MYKFSMSKSLWMKILAPVVNLSDRKQVMPILGYLWANKKDDQLYLVGTDLETEVRVKLPLEKKLGEDITFLLPGKTFFNICNLTGEGEDIELSITQENIVVSAQASRYKLISMDPKDFPLYQEKKESYQWEISLPSKILKNLLKKTTFAADEQNVRQYLNGIMFSVEKGEITAIATDTHRMAVAKSELSSLLTEKQSFILPKKTAQELQRLLGDEGEVRLQAGTNSIKLSAEKLMVYAKLIAGKFPDYQKIIPDRQGHRVTLNTSLMIQAINKVGILVDGNSRIVKLSLSKDGLIIDSNTINQGARDLLVIDYQGEPIEILLNLDYLRETLRQIETLEVDFYFKEARQAVMLQPAGLDNLLYVIMPVIS